MTIAAAITTFDRLPALMRCVAHVRGQSRRPDEIIVVNDSSGDGTRAWLDAQSDITAIHQPDNRGSAVAFATAMRAAYERGHRYIWTMDDDVFAEPDALAALLEAAGVLGTAGVRVGGLVPYQSNWHRDGVARLPFRLPSTLYHALRYRYMSPETVAEMGRGEPVEVDSYSFCGTLFTREAMAAAGFPDPSFFYYGEDYDYAYRLTRHGFRNFLVPTSIVLHAGCGASTDVPRGPRHSWRNYYMYRNQWTIVRRYADRLGPAKAAACRARIVLDVVLRVASDAVAGDLRGCRMSLRGLLHGLTGRTGKIVPPAAGPMPG